MTNASLRLLVLAGVLMLIVAALTGANRADAAEERVTLLEQIDDLRDRDLGLAAPDARPVDADLLRRA